MKTTTIILLCAAALLTGRVLAGDGLEAGREGQAKKVEVLIISRDTGLLERLQAAHSLSLNLDSAQINVLYQFLKSHPAPDESNIAGLRYLKNEVFAALRSQNNPPSGLTAVMIEIYQDHNQDFVTRDYAIQHLITWYAQGAGDAPDAKERIRAALMESARAGDSIAGTALLGMHRLAKNDSAFKTDQIKRVALDIVQTAQANEPARITAMQVCAERGVVEAVPAIETFAQARGRTALQISAISALGRLGGPEQATLLRRLASDKNKLLEPAIRAAMTQVERNVASRNPF